jgi:hypothetical protein
MVAYIIKDERGRAAAAGEMLPVWKVLPPLDTQAPERAWGESSGSGTETIPRQVNAMMPRG